MIKIIKKFFDKNIARKMYRQRWFSGFFNKDFAWKVNRRMQYDKNPLFIILLDKYKVKEFARLKGVQTARLFYVTDHGMCQ